MKLERYSSLRPAMWWSPVPEPGYPAWIASKSRLVGSSQMRAELRMQVSLPA
jgi:hypothetical protein